MVRPGTLQDLEQVNEIRRQVNDLHVNGEPTIFKSGFSKEMQEYVKTFIGSDTKQLFVAENNGNICAFAMIEIVVKPETPYAYEQKFLDLQELGTNESCKGKGYGKELINYIKQYAKQNSVNQIRLNMWSFNEGALKFYNKMGFSTFRRHLRLDV